MNLENVLPWLGAFLGLLSAAYYSDEVDKGDIMICTYILFSGYFITKAINSLPQPQPPAGPPET